MKNYLFTFTVIIIAGGAGFFLQQFLTDNGQEKTISTVLNKPAQEFSMKDLDGNIRNITDWKGDVVLLNFWATWCPPCLKEIPAFIELQTKYKSAGFQVIGIAMDNIKAVKSFATAHGMNYPIIPADAEAIELGKRYGNTAGVLPYSVFINRNGDVTHTITGELDKLQAEKILATLNIN